MSGGGIGGTLGSLAGAALAPETGGLSLAIPAAMGAGGAYLGGALTGSKNPLMDALMGGVGGGLSGALSGGQNMAGFFDPAGSAGAGAETISRELLAADPSLASGAGTNLANTATIGGGAGGIGNIASGATSSAQNTLTPGTQAFLDSLSSGTAPTTANIINGTAGGAAAPSSWFGGKNMIQDLNLAGLGLKTLSGFMNPPTPVNVAQNTANTKATSSNMNATLPKYNLVNTGTPYTGNWNTYGQAPQQAMYNGNMMPQALARGGKVKGYADGGAIPASPLGMPIGMPPQGMPQQQGGQPQVNPLAIQKAHQIGMAIGTHLRQHGYNPNSTPDGKVVGMGGGQDDLVPAKLSQDEYIVPADTVSALGDGSSNAGGKALDKMVNNVRAHKATKGFPPKAKNPLSYLPRKAIV